MTIAKNYVAEMVMGMRSISVLALATTIGAAAPSFGQTVRPSPPAPQNVRDAAAVLALAPRVQIGAGDMKATILLPARDNSFYRGVRFDNSGIVSSVKYQDQEFYGLWFDKLAENVRDFIFDNGEVIAGVNTGALGPAEVYDPENPPGWEETGAGGGFLKIGVGVLRKPSPTGAYSQFAGYEPVSLGVWKVIIKKDRVEMIHTVSDTASGYGYIYRKVIKVASNGVLRIEHILTNTGSKAISTTAYNHNFITFGGEVPTGHGLTVSTRSDIVAGPLSDVAELTRNKLVYRRALLGEQRFSTPIGGFPKDAGSYDVSVHNASGAGFRVIGDVPMSRMVLWSIRRTVAAEPYVSLRIAPAKTVSWTFQYQYSSKSAGIAAGSN